MLWTDCAWSVVSKVILDGRIAQYLADLSKKTSKLYKKGRRVLVTTTVKLYISCSFSDVQSV